MRPVWLMLGLIGFGLPAADAQQQKFPYEAVVDSDDEQVRCGPGPKYYATSKLVRGTRVMVHRHDPGGWAMIAPPEGSFSWIQAEYVQKSASGRGTLTANNVIVHVGSVLNEERSVYQRTMSRGDSVEVIGEARFTTDRGPRHMYKILPPAREYRWIAGKSLAPANGRSTPAAPNKPLAPAAPIPSIQGPIARELEMEVAAESDAFAPSPFSTSPVSLEGGSGVATAPAMPNIAAATDAERTVSETGQPLESLEGLRVRLTELDSRFRTTLQADPPQWNLTELRQSYVELEQAARHPAFTSHVQQRLATLERYRKIQQDYVDFDRLTSETRERDARLMSLQRQQEEQLRSLEAAAATAAANQGTSTSPGSPSPTPFGMPPNPLDSSEPSARAPGAPAATPVPEAPAAPAAQPMSQTRTPSKFSGAGIVQRSTIPAPGVPPYMLIAPDGRLLAYLEPAPGIDLGQAQNQSLGIIGERGYRDTLKTDVIVVRGFQPVQLRSAMK